MDPLFSLPTSDFAQALAMQNLGCMEHFYFLFTILYIYIRFDR